MAAGSKRAGKVSPSKSRRAGAVCYAKGCHGDAVLAVCRPDRLKAGFALALLCAAALTLTACGRAGPLELPPGPATQPTASAAPPPSSQTPLAASTGNGSVESDPAALEKAQKSGFDRYGNPVAPTGEKKSFPLDFLLQ